LNENEAFADGKTAARDSQQDAGVTFQTAF